jgi:DNA-binding MurR/RpiR family transcriptional regulator
MADIVERLRSEVDPDVNEPLDRLLDEAADKIERLRKALEEINSQAVCACIAKEDECFQMLQNCAEISDDALSNSSGIRKSES